MEYQRRERDLRKTRAVGAATLLAVVLVAIHPGLEGLSGWVTAGLMFASAAIGFQYAQSIG